MDSSPAGKYFPIVKTIQNYVARILCTHKWNSVLQKAPCRVYGDACSTRLTLQTVPVKKAGNRQRMLKGSRRPMLGKFTSILLISVFLMTSLSCETARSSEEKHYYRGIELGIQGKFEEAKTEFAAALQLNPLYTPAEGSLRIVKDALAERIQARTAVLLFKAIDYGNLNDPDKKIAEINQAININPDYAIAYNERGIAYSNKELYDQAISDRDKAIQLDPQYAAPYYNKAVACEKTGRLEEALEAYQGFIKYAPPEYEPHINYSRRRIAAIEKELAIGAVEDK